MDVELKTHLVPKRLLFRNHSLVTLFTGGPDKEVCRSRIKLFLARNCVNPNRGGIKKLGVIKARLPLIHPNFSMTMKKLARSYRQSRSNSR
jgi:hypothetical protein